MYANVVLIAFLLVSVIIFGFLIVLVRQIKKDGQLSQDRLTRLTAFLFIPALLIFALTLYGISSWRAEIKHQQNRIEIAQFVNSVYKPLAASQQSLLQSIQHMRKLRNSLAPLRDNHPNHAEMLKNIASEWRSSQQTLYNLYTQTDKEIRHAWISYKTMNRQDVLDKFYTKAVKLNDKITKLNRDYQIGVRGAKDELIMSIDTARRMLNNKKKTKKSKNKSKKQTTNNNTPIIFDFKDSTITVLLNYLSQIDIGLEIEVQRLREDIRLAQQRQEEVRLYLIDNPDLEKPLNKVLDDWVLLQTNNRTHLNRILFAIEAEYLADELGLSKKNQAIKAMHKSYKLKIPSIVGKAQKQREVLERSYNIK